MTSRTASMLGAAGSAVMGSEEHGLAVRAEHRLQSVPDLVEGAVGPSAIEHRRDHIAVVQGGLAEGLEPPRHEGGGAVAAQPRPPPAPAPSALVRYPA